MNSVKISISRNDDETTVFFGADHVPGMKPDHAASELGLRATVPFVEIGAEVARLVDASHVVVTSATVVRRVTASCPEADFSRTVRPI